MKILVAQEKLIFIKYTMYVALSANSNHCYFLAGFPRLLFDLLCQRATSCLPVLSLPWPGRACHPRRPAAVDLPELSVCAKPQKMQSIWAAQWANRSLQTVALPFSRLLARPSGCGLDAEASTAFLCDAGLVLPLCTIVMEITTGLAFAYKVI